MTTELRFDTLPSLTSLYAKSLVTRRKPSSSPVLPDVAARASMVKVDAAQLANYRSLCGFTYAGVLPPTFPMILATPLHAALIAHEAFPFSALGLVHVSNRIEQHRPITDIDVLSIRCHTEGPREARTGWEFDFVTRVDTHGTLAWESRTTVLARTGKPAPRGDRKVTELVPGEAGGALKSVIWRLPADLGRQYAAISGDYNPIHLNGLAARAFGFPRAIIHGMWTLARGLSELGEHGQHGERVIDVAFKKPVLLPSTVLFHAHEAEGGAREFAVRGKDGTSVHLSGRIATLADRMR